MLKLTIAGMFGLFPLECCVNVLNPNKLSEVKIWWFPFAEFSKKPIPKPSRNHKVAHVGKNQNRSSIARDRIGDYRNSLSLRGLVLK
jgi:hypothetical protein